MRAIRDCIRSGAEPAAGGFGARERRVGRQRLRRVVLIHLCAAIPSSNVHRDSCCPSRHEACARVGRRPRRGRGRRAAALRRSCGRSGAVCRGHCGFGAAREASRRCQLLTRLLLKHYRRTTLCLRSCSIKQSGLLTLILSSCNAIYSFKLFYV